jgi:hypothetical protein
MNEQEDLGCALAFVIGRIEQEATRSGETLSEEQRFLLHNLPRESSLPAMNGGDPEAPLPIIARDLAYERLISLARDAYRHDLGVNPAGVEWKIAFAVSKLNRHPMAWLLAWAGMKERRPWWDRAGLVGAALLLTGTALALMIFAGLGGGTRLRWIGAGTACIAMALLIGYASSHLERWQLRQRLEKYRRTSVGSEK